MRGAEEAPTTEQVRCGSLSNAWAWKPVLTLSVCAVIVQSICTGAGAAHAIIAEVSVELTVQRTVRGCEKTRQEKTFVLPAWLMNKLTV